MIRIGYACINLSLEASTNGTTRLALIGDRERWIAPCQRNLQAMKAILPFNGEHGLNFRIGSQMVPFASHAALPHDWESLLGADLRALGAQAKDLGIRLSMHPGQYCIPGSPRPEVVESSLAELRYSARLLHLMGVDDGVVVVHMGGQYGDFEATRQRTVANLRGEHDILRYLAFEHDDRIWAAHDVLPVCDQLGIPLIVDNLHYQMLPGKLEWRSLLFEAIARWRGRRPKFHLSSQASGKRPGAHSDRISDEDIKMFSEVMPCQDYDLMVEAKEKELAALEVQRKLLDWGCPVLAPHPILSPTGTPSS